MHNVSGLAGWTGAWEEKTGRSVIRMFGEVCGQTNRHNMEVNFLSHSKAEEVQAK